MGLGLGTVGVHHWPSGIPVDLGGRAGQQAVGGEQVFDLARAAPGRLRRKLGEPDPIDTVVGSGYRLP